MGKTRERGEANKGEQPVAVPGGFFRRFGFWGQAELANLPIRPASRKNSEKSGILTEVFRFPQRMKNGMRD